MSGQVLSLSPGTRLFLKGDVTEIVAIDGPQVTVRNDRTCQFTTMRLAQLAAGARPVDAMPPGGGDVPSGLALGA